MSCEIIDLCPRELNSIGMDKCITMQGPIFKPRSSQKKRLLIFI